MAVTDLAQATRIRILDAAFDAVADFGLRRLTMELVAGRAGLSRQSLYRYFPTKDDLLLALVMREEERFLDGVRAAFAVDPDLEDAIEDAVAFVLRYARRHELLDRLLETDPEILLPYLTVRARPVVDRARDVVAELILEKTPDADPALVRTAADGSARLLLSYAITPPDEPVSEIAKTFARLLSMPIEASRREPQ